MDLIQNTLSRFVSSGYELSSDKRCFKVVSLSHLPILLPGPPGCFSLLLINETAVMTAITEHEAVLT